MGGTQDDLRIFWWGNGYGDGDWQDRPGQVFHAYAGDSLPRLRDEANLWKPSDVPDLPQPIQAPPTSWYFGNAGKQQFLDGSGKTQERTLAVLVRKEVWPRKGRKLRLVVGAFVDPSTDARSAMRIAQQLQRYTAPSEVAEITLPPTGGDPRVVRPRAIDPPSHDNLIAQSGECDPHHLADLLDRLVKVGLKEIAQSVIVEAGSEERIRDYLAAALELLPLELLPRKLTFATMEYQPDGLTWIRGRVKGQFVSSKSWPDALDVTAEPKKGGGFGLQLVELGRRPWTERAWRESSSWDEFRETCQRMHACLAEPDLADDETIAAWAAGNEQGFLAGLSDTRLDSYFSALVRAGDVPSAESTLAPQFQQWLAQLPATGAATLADDQIRQAYQAFSDDVDPESLLALAERLNRHPAERVHRNCSANASEGGCCDLELAAVRAFERSHGTKRVREAYDGVVTWVREQQISAGAVGEVGGRGLDRLAGELSRGGRGLSDEAVASTLRCLDEQQRESVLDARIRAANSRHEIHSECREPDCAFVAEFDTWLPRNEGRLRELKKRKAHLLPLGLKDPAVVATEFLEGKHDVVAELDLVDTEAWVEAIGKALTSGADKDALARRVAGLESRKRVAEQAVATEATFDFVDQHLLPTMLRDRLVKRIEALGILLGRGSLVFRSSKLPESLASEAPENPPGQDYPLRNITSPEDQDRVAQALSAVGLSPTIVLAQSLTEDRRGIYRGLEEQYLPLLTLAEHLCRSSQSDHHGTRLLVEKILPVLPRDERLDILGETSPHVAAAYGLSDQSLLGSGALVLARPGAESADRIGRKAGQAPDGTRHVRGALQRQRAMQGQQAMQGQRATLGQQSMQGHRAMQGQQSMQGRATSTSSARPDTQPSDTPRVGKRIVLFVLALVLVVLLALSAAFLLKNSSDSEPEGDVAPTTAPTQEPAGPPPGTSPPPSAPPSGDGASL